MQSKNYIADENIKENFFLKNHSRFSQRLFIALLLFCGLPAASEIRAATITVDRTDDTAAASACTAAANDCSVRGAFAFANANSGTVINIPAGTYNLTIDELQVGTATNVLTTINGAGPALTTINQNVVNRRVIDLNPSLSPNVVVNISGVRITGGNSPSDNFGGGGLLGGGAGNTLNISNCVFENNSDINALTAKGGGIEWAGGGFLNIDNCTFNNNTAGSAAGNKGVGGGVDYQLLNLAGESGKGGLTITNSTFTNNKAGASNAGAGGGLALTVTTVQTPRTVTVTNNTFTGNQANAASNGLGGAITSSSSNPSITIKYNRITGNTASGSAGTGIYKALGTTGTIDATQNWWGCNAGPTNANCNTIGGLTSGISTNPRIVLTHTQNTIPIVIGQATVLTASFLRDSANNVLTTANVSRLIGLPITFNNPVRGTLSGAQTAIQANGTATANFTSNAVGAGSADAVVDNQTTTASITINKGSTSITMNSSTPNSTVTGQSYTVAFNAPTTSAPTSIALTGSVTVSDGTASCTATLPATNCLLTSISSGIKNLTAVYNGDANFNASPVSAAIQQTVNSANTTTVINSTSPNPSGAGQNVVVSYSVAPLAPGAGMPSGTVTVSDGTNSCVGTVSGGQCIITLPASGTYNLTAVYTGDTNFATSTSPIFTHQVCGGSNLMVSNTSDSGAGSLRNALAGACSGGTINFSPDFNTPQMIMLTGELVIDRDITINGAGANLLTINANNTGRVFHITGGTVNLSGMTITGGNAAGGGNGGGIANLGGTLTLTNSVVSGNTAPNLGGGIYSMNPLTIVGSTLSGNTANNAVGSTGGGIHSTGSLLMVNSTISGNSVSNGDGNGGGIRAENTTSIINSTITNNSAVGANSAVGVLTSAGIVTVRNSIIAANQNNTSTPDATGSFDPASAFNFIGNVGTATGFSAANQNQTGNSASPLNPMLGALETSGGATPTHALLTGSPAIDKGGAASIPFAEFILPPVTSDQRGMMRPVDIASIPNAAGGDGSDIGAFELSAPTAANASVSGRVLTNDNRGLQNAVVMMMDSNGNIRTTRTSSFGYFIFENVEAGQTYIFQIKAKRFTFNPQIVTVNDDVTEMIFTATAELSFQL